MGYSVKITRVPSLTLDEWKRVVRGRQDVRLQEEPATARNPRTGEVISLGLAAGDAEILVDGEWMPCFWWREGDAGNESPSAAVFDAPHDFESPGCHVRTVARDLANTLNARLIGEEGEEYD